MSTSKSEYPPASRADHPLELDNSAPSACGMRGVNLWRENINTSAPARDHWPNLHFESAVHNGKRLVVGNQGVRVATGDIDLI